MRDRGAEADHAAGDEDRREDEHVGDVLAALERVVVDQEVALLQRLDRVALQAGAQGLADRPELHRDELGLRHRVAVPVHQAGRAVARLAQDGRIGRADQLHAHLARRRDQRLADDGLVDRAEVGHDALRRIRLSGCIERRRPARRHPGRGGIALDDGRADERLARTSAPRRRSGRTRSSASPWKILVCSGARAGQRLAVEPGRRCRSAGSRRRERSRSRPAGRAWRRA